MADAKKCDRCGAYYDTNIGQKYKLSRKASSSLLRDHVFDLCPSCNSLIDEFMSFDGPVEEKKEKPKTMLNPCNPCLCIGAPCEQCQFGYRTAEENHESMKRILLDTDANSFNKSIAEAYKDYHPDWEERLKGEQK